MSKNLQEGKNPLHEAVSENNINNIKKLLANNPKLANQKDAAGNTPLHLVSSVEATELLLQKMNTSSIIAKNNEGYNALYYPVKKDQLEIVEALIKKNPSLCIDGIALQEAKFSANAEISKLIEHHYKVIIAKMKTEAGKFAEKIEEYATSNSYQINLNSKTSMMEYTCSFKSLSRGDNILHVLVINNADINVIKRVLSIQPNLVNIKNSNGQTPLDTIKFWHPLAAETIALLEQTSNNVHEAENNFKKNYNEQGNNRLHEVVIVNKKDLVRSITELSEIPEYNVANIKGRYPICYAKDEEVIKHLLKRMNDAEIKHQDKNGNTVLHHLVRDNNTNIMFDNSKAIMYLVAKYPSLINIENSNGLLPLDLAEKENIRNVLFQEEIEQKNSDEIQKITEDKLEKFIESNNNNQLHKAVFNDNKDEFSKIMFNNPKSANQKNDLGQTALHFASDEYFMIHLLEMMSKEAMSAQDLNGNNAAFYIAKKDLFELLKSLINKGSAFITNSKILRDPDINEPIKNLAKEALEQHNEQIKILKQQLETYLKNNSNANFGDIKFSGENNILHMSCGFRDFELAKSINQGNPHLKYQKNNIGQTPSDIAKFWYDGEQDCMSFLGTINPLDNID